MGLKSLCKRGSTMNGKHHPIDLFTSLQKQSERIIQQEKDLNTYKGLVIGTIISITLDCILLYFSILVF